MSVVERVTALEKQVEELAKSVGVQDERVSGRGGVSASLDALAVAMKADMATLADDVKALKRTLWTVGVGVVGSSIAFAFSVLKLVGGG